MKETRKFLAAGIASRADRVAKSLAAARAEPSIVNTHALSTSLRRLLVCNQVTRRLFGERLLTRRQREKIDVLRTTLGDLRDAQELPPKFASLELSPSPFTVASQAHFRDNEKNCQERFLQALQGFKGRFLETLAEPREVRQLLGRQMTEPPLNVLRFLLDEVLALRPVAIDNGDDQALHRLRVTFKKFRYAYELFTPELTGANEKDLAFLHSIQEALGQAHDWLVLGQVLAEVGRGMRGEVAARRLIRRRSDQVHAETRTVVAGRLHNLQLSAHLADLAE